VTTGHILASARHGCNTNETGARYDFRNGLNPMRSYLRNLNTPRIVLWSYLLWYLGVLARHFDPSLSLWVNALGLSAIMGTAYCLSAAYAGSRVTRLDGWQVSRMYLMPFCVSSFAALIKDRGFVLVFHPTLHDNLLAVAPIAAFCGVVFAVKRTGRGALETLAAGRALS
jgi:hypothetical protein